MRTIFRFFILGTLVCLFSCKTTKPTQYFEGLPDSSGNSIPEIEIQKGDLLGIMVYSDNPEATLIYNQSMASGGASSATLNAGAGSGSVVGALPQSMPGYYVDDRGNIQFQSIGSMHVEGLTKSQLEDLLKEKLSAYLKNPYLSIRFLNFKITVLGEVNRPSVFAISNERVNILEALGMAGDMNVYGLKENITVIREANGKREYGTLDVSKSGASQSPYFYLRQNDIVIVKANPKKPTVSEQVTQRNLAVVGTLSAIVTSLGILYSIFRK